MSNPAPGEQPPPLRVSRIFKAPRAVVFKAWSSAEHVKAWFSPETFNVPEARVEMRVGGPFEVLMRAPWGQENWTRGTFTEVSPHDRLVIDMGVATPEGHALFSARTEVTFTAVEGGTRMDVVQSYVFADPAMAAPMVAGASEGWRTTLDKLEREVARMAAPERSVVHATFHLERVYDSTPQRVWKAFADPTAKDLWFGTVGDMEILDRYMDVRAGGTERAKGRWRTGVVSSFDAIYHDVIPNERLVYSYEMHLDDRKISVSLATVQIRVEGTKTRVLVTEQGAFLDGYDDAGAREHGTGLLLDRLGQSLAQ